MDPQVSVEIHGVAIDNARRKTHRIDNNGKLCLLYKHHRLVYQSCDGFRRKAKIPPDAVVLDTPLMKDATKHYAAATRFFLKGLPRHIFTALVRPLQASTLAGTAHWASRCRFLIWPWCVLWLRTTITEQRTTLWASSLCLSPACEQVLAHTEAHVHLLGYYSPNCGFWRSDNYTFSFQGIDTFIYWRQMAPVCPLQRFSSMSKWPAKEFPSRACQTALQWPKARRLDAHQKIAAFSDTKKGPLEKLRSEERKSLLPPAASPVQNSSVSILHWDPLVQGGKKHAIYPIWSSLPAFSKWMWKDNDWRFTVWIFGNITDNCGFLINTGHRIWLKTNFIVNFHIWRSYRFSKEVSNQSFILLDMFFK